MEKLAGSRLGPYEIVAPIGAGGMGEVYRAKDPRLKREVAIKILSQETFFDSQRQKRFQREAQAASSLNHPNILVVYDIGAENGRSFIVSELVEGESLRKLIQGGPVAGRKLLDLAVQIADGLSAAHQAGIVHRDLKPENIMVTREGHVKILDFGLAKLTGLESADRTAETISGPLTASGIIQGTVPYMSPEQAKGDSIDFRSDQFSLGSILYEMASGKRPFQRESAPQTLSAILSEEPTPIAELNPKLPAPLRWLIERCLAKDPQHRYDSTRDLYRDLRNLRDHLSETSGIDAASRVAPSPARSRLRLWATVASMVLAAVAAIVFFVGKRAGFVAGQKAAEKEVSFQRVTFRRGNVMHARFVPGSNNVVYGASWEGNPMEIFLTSPGNPESRPFGIAKADVLSVSTSGELAVLFHEATLRTSSGVGILATLR